MAADRASSPADHDRVYELIMAAWGSQAVRTLAHLSVAEHLESGPLSAQDIAHRESSDPAMTYRLLRAGAALGLLRHDADEDVFSGTPMLRVLHADSPDSLKHYAQAAIGPAFWLPALKMPEAVREGQDQAVQALGSDVFGYFSQHQDEARTFGAAMTDLSGPVIREAVSVIDVAGAQLAVDVGGADGAFVCELVQGRPQLHGLVLELPHAVPGVAAHAERRGMADRVTGVPGDFFAAVPSADVYLLKHILHDWDDASCVTILSAVRAAMRPGARLFVVEMVVSTAGAAVGATLMDMAMLFATGGQEREIPQFDALLESAHLRRTRVVPIRTPYAVIEAEAT